MHNTRKVITKLVNTPAMSSSLRHYPGQYELGKYRKTLSENDKRRFCIEQHDATHYNIRNKQTQEIQGILTSAQNKQQKHEFNIDKLDSVKKNGTFIPLKDSNGDIIYDSQGNMIPDPNKGGQYVATFSRSRIIKKDAESFFEVDESGQEYVDKHEKKLDSIFEKNLKKTGKKKQKNIGGADEEPK